MKGDFTQFTYNKNKHYNRVLKQQGRVDLDADWNESVEISTHLERIEAIDVIGKCGVPQDSNGYKIEINADNDNLTISPGRIYVDGILCSNDADAPVLITEQANLPDFALPEEEDGTYIAYLDVWERHITYVEDPEIREVALGGPDTATRVQTVCQVKLSPVEGTGPLEDLECQAYEPVTNTGLVTAQTITADKPSNPCVVPANAGYTGLENRLYRVEIHNDGRNEEGTLVSTPTFKWSRDNGSVVLPIAEDGIDGDGVIVKRLGHDEVLTVKVGDWVEILGDQTELKGTFGTLTQIEPDGIDKTNLEITLVDDVSDHDTETHLKMRRWDHHATADVNLEDGALPIQGDWFELEDGVQVLFDVNANYNIGDYWLIPARTREGSILWPNDGTNFLPQARLGIHHHYCTLALLQREDGQWTDVRDCRRLFPPLTELQGGGCCIRLQPGDDIQQAIDTAIGEGGGCIALCQGVHEVMGHLDIVNAVDLKIVGENASTVLKFVSPNNDGQGGMRIYNGQRISIEDMFVVSDSVQSLVSVLHNEDLDYNRYINFHRLTLLNLLQSNQKTSLACAIKVGHTKDITIHQCQIVAEVGVISLWGNALPDIALQDEQPTNEIAGSSQLSVEFEDLTVGDMFRLGDNFVDSGVSVETRTFVWSNGQTFAGGFCRVDNQGNAGGTGNDLEINNINLNFILDNAQDSISLQFADFGGNTNLRINGELRNVNNIFNLDGETIGGVNVSVTVVDADSDTGILSLQAMANQISEFVIGGQELWIDNVLLGRGEQQIPGYELNIGKGVFNASVCDNDIRYLNYGILAAKTGYWTLRDNSITPYSSLELVASIFAGLGNSSELSRLTLLQLQLVLSEGVSQPSGSAIHAYNWSDCSIRHCQLSGMRGIDIWWWFRGDASKNSIHAEQRGIYAFWYHNVCLEKNRLMCRNGNAISMAGSYRARVNNNHIRAYTGVVTLNENTEFKALPNHVAVLSRAYRTGSDQFDDFGDNILQLYVLYILLVEVVEFMGLREAINRLSPMFSDYDPMIFVTLLVNANFNDPEWELNYPLPIIDLRLNGNDIECADVCIYMEEAFVMGGLSVTSNRLHTITGQAVRLNADLLSANPHLLIALWRMGFKMFIETIFPELISAIGNNANMNSVVRAAVISFLQGLLALMTEWSTASETFLEADIRVSGNSIRSLASGVESNLWGIVVSDNHITMQERRYSNIESIGIVDTLLTNAVTAPIGYAIRDGSRYNINRASYAVSETDVLENTNTRGGVAATVYNVSSGVSNRSINVAGTRLAAAINAGDRNSVLERVDEFVIALANLVDNYGIWVKAPGCQISRNHVLVPQDAEEETRARGGIKISSDGEDEAGNQLAVLALLAAEMGLDPLSGVTETVIIYNEVMGGFGHGVHIQAPVTIGQGQVDIALGFVNLKIAENQIVSMAGGGIVIDEETFAIGVDLLNNKITDCSSQPDLADLTNEHGGIVIENAALCRINGNRIRHCGSGQESVDVFAVDLESVYGLTMSNNYLMYNGAESTPLSNGGISLTDIYGDVAIHENDLLFQRGIGLVWNNSLSSDVSPLPESLLNNVILYLQGIEAFSGNVSPVLDSQEARSSRATIQNNQFKMANDVEVQAFNLFNIHQLDFSSNKCNTVSKQHLGTITNVMEWLIVSNNTLKTNGDNTMVICKGASGIVDNNVGNKPIDIEFSNLQIGSNIPPTV